MKFVLSVVLVFAFLMSAGACGNGGGKSAGTRGTAGGGCPGGCAQGQCGQGGCAQSGCNNGQCGTSQLVRVNGQWVRVSVQQPQQQSAPRVQVLGR